MPNTEVLEKLEKVASGMKELQEVNDRLEKKYDALDIEHVEKAADAASKAYEQAQQLEQKLAAIEQAANDRIENLELNIAKGGENLTDEKFNQEHKTGLVKYMRRGTPMDDELIEKNCDALARKALIGVDDDQIERFKKDLVSGSGPDGGYFLTPDRSTDISRRIFETSPLRTVANVVTTVSDTLEIVLDDDEFSGGWVGEVTSRSKTDSSEIGLVKIPVHEIYANPRATQKMIDDAGFDLEAWVSGKVSRKLARMENSSFVAGDGAQKPKGFLSYSAWAAAGTYERNKVEQRTSGSNGDFDADDLIDLQSDLLEDYQMSAAWGMTRKTFGHVMKLKDSNGAYLLNPRIVAEGAMAPLLGKDVVIMSDMQEIATDSLSVVYADWMEFYTIVDRFGLRVLRDPYTAKPYIQFYTTKRVGGAVTNFQAGKILKLSA